MATVLAPPPSGRYPTPMRRRHALALVILALVVATVLAVGPAKVCPVEARSRRRGR